MHNYYAKLFAVLPQHITLRRETFTMFRPVLIVFGISTGQFYTI